MSFTRYRANNGARGVLRDGMLAFAIASALMLVSIVDAQASARQRAPNSFSRQARAAGDTIKHDSKVVGAAFKDGAHRVTVAAKAVGHEVAMAARRGAAKTRAAFRGEK